MAVVALDTYEVVKELRAAGFDEAQAAALTNAVKRAQQINLSELATKSDLLEQRAAIETENAKSRAETKSDLAELRTSVTSDISNVRREISELRSEVFKTLLTVVGVQTVVIIGAVAGLIRVLAT